MFGPSEILNDTFGDTSEDTATSSSAAMTLDESGYSCNITGKGVQMTGAFVGRLTSLVNAGSRLVDNLTSLTDSRVNLVEARTRRDEVANRRLELILEESEAKRAATRESTSLMSTLLGGLRDGGGMFNDRHAFGRY